MPYLLEISEKTFAILGNDNIINTYTICEKSTDADNTVKYQFEMENFLFRPIHRNGLILVIYYDDIKS